MLSVLAEAVCIFLSCIVICYQEALYGLWYCRLEVGRAVAQAVSRWLPATAAQVHVQAEDVGFVVDKATLGQVFSKYFGFPCQSFYQFLHHHNHPGLTQ
jgi:hypothetical protein